MDADMLTTVAERYPWSSWAVWDDSFPDGNCVEETPEKLREFVRQRRDELTTDVVLLGLNRSDDLPAPFSNFHAPTKQHYDYRLKETIQDGGLNRLHGAFMTDLVDEVDPDSTSVMVTDEDAELFLEQAGFFGNDEVTVICFGNKPFDGLIRYFDAGVSTSNPELKQATIELNEMSLHLYRTWFYGLYGIHQAKVEVFRTQLEELNDRV